MLSYLQTENTTPPQIFAIKGSFRRKGDYNSVNMDPSVFFYKAKQGGNV